MEAYKQIPLEGMRSQKRGKEIGDNQTSPGDGVAEMLGRLKLTTEESRVLTVDDDVEEGLATSDSAIVGKVLSTSVLHIQTIMGALRNAWGNPKGLVVRSVGENLFIAEFGSKQDMERILDGAPWNVSKRAVLFKRYVPNLRPADMVFNKMPIWVRIMNLPFGLMNKRWGFELAGMIGEVEKLELDEHGRAWGPYLRARVAIDVSKPLRRCVGIFSTRRQAHEWYDVRYEKLPHFCFSCGIIGHSSVECRTPAERDGKGLLPYGEDLWVSDEKRKKIMEERQSLGSSSSARGANSNSHHEGISTRSPQCKPDNTANERDRTNNTTFPSSEEIGEKTTSPLQYNEKEDSVTIKA